MVALTPLEMASRLGAALLAGGLIGLDRQRHRHAAGLRTMILVSVGSGALAMLGSDLAVEMANQPGMPAGTTLGADAASRVIQGIVGGIGFLGAGVVMRSGMRVRGITSAASIWVTAAIGIACGMGHFMLAGMTLVATLFALVFLKPIEDSLFPQTHRPTASTPRPRRSTRNGRNGNGGKPVPAEPEPGQASDQPREPMD